MRSIRLDAGFAQDRVTGKIVEEWILAANARHASRGDIDDGWRCNGHALRDR